MRIAILPHEPFSVKGGRLELALLTTHFSPTVLDGYQEHTQERVFCSMVVPLESAFGPGSILFHTERLRLPDAPSSDPRPARRELQATVRFDVEGFRQLRATRILRNVGLWPSHAPVVDGRGFLPY